VVILKDVSGQPICPFSRAMSLFILEDGPISSLETMLRNCQSTLRNTQDERKSNIKPKTLLLRSLGNTEKRHNCTFYIFFLLVNSYMFRHCRHLQETYTKLSFKHTAINTNIIISIIAKKFYKPI